jgi:DNA invertase Pin-like site-specific DNA recombinase
LSSAFAEDRIYLDHGLTGTNRDRPGLDQALAAVRAGDTLVVPKLDRLARSVPDARDIGDSLVARGVKLSLGGTSYDPSDPMGKMFFNILATFAEFEVDLLRLRTREGMAIARAKGKLRGRQPKLSPAQQAHLVKLHGSGEHSIAELAELFSVSRPTVYRVLERAQRARARAKSSDRRSELRGCWRREAAIRCRVWAVAAPDQSPGRADLGRSRVLTMRVEGTGVTQEARLRPLAAKAAGQTSQS